MTTPLPPCTCSPDTLSHDCLRHGWFGVRESRGPKRTGLRARSWEKQFEAGKWAGIREALLYVFGSNAGCAICGDKFRVGEEIHADHIVPLGKGGSNTADNCQLTHASCHLESKHRNMPMWSSNE